MAGPLYKPPTRVTTREVPYLTQVTNADPNWSQEKYRAVEYEFQGKVFYANPYAHGGFNRLSNVYPVGQPQGTVDPLITEALAPTAGNLVPGLYSSFVYVGPGDVLPGAIGGWSLRAWSRATIGAKAVRLIASSDTGLTGAQADFGTLPNGSLDVVSIAAFQAVHPGKDLFIVKFYDQTLNGQDLTCFAQVDHYIPKFQLGAFGTRPAIFQDNLNMNLTSGVGGGGPTLTIGTPFSMMMIFNYNEVFPGIQPFNNETTAPGFTEMGFQLNQGGTNTNKIAMRTSKGVAQDFGTLMDCSDFNWHGVIGVFDAERSVGYVDGVAAPQPTMISREADPNGFVGLFSSPFGGNALSGMGVEGGMWDRALSVVESNSLAANMAKYWGLTPPPPPAPAAYVGPGDVLPGATGGWSLRAWTNAAIGTKAVRLIASNDAGLTGAQRDFVTLSDGSLDVSSIAAFLFANPGTSLFVKKFYDQTLNGQDLTSFAQISNYVPKFQLAAFGARPVISLDNLNMNLTSGGPSFNPTLTIGTPYTALMVFNYNEVFAGIRAFNLQAGAPTFTQLGLSLNRFGTNLNKIDMDTVVGASTDISTEMPCSDLDWHSVIGVFDAANSVGYIDGTGFPQSAMVGRAADPNGFVGLFGSPFGGNALSGLGVEGGMWNRALSASEADALAINLRTYWGLPPAPPPPPPPPPPSYVGPGDVLPGAAGAWALRAWSAATVGTRAVRLIASSDAGVTGPQSDFVTLADGSLDVASIATFLAANPGKTLFVAKLYDQTGSGQDLTSFAQTANYVPKFQLAGFGPRPIIFQDNLNMNLTSGGPSFTAFTFGTPFTLVAIFKYDETFQGVTPFNLSAGAPNFSQMGFSLNPFGTNTNKIDMRTTVGASSTVSTEMPCPDFAFHSVVGVFNAASSVGYIDGTGIAQPAMISQAPDTHGFVGLFGAAFGGSALSGAGVEAAMYSRAISSVEAAALTANMRTYWGLPAAPYFGPGDIRPGATGWWGLRAYSSAAIGTNAVQLIASSDAGLTGPTANFVTLANGSLDVASIATFLAANPGKTLFVTKLYDQTGNGFHATPFAQTSNYVPKFQLSGLGALPVILQDNTNMNLTSKAPSPAITAASPLTIVVVANNTSSTGEMAFELNQEAGNVDRTYIQYNFGGSHPNTVNMQEAVATVFYASGNMPCTDNSWHSIVAVYNAASSVGYVDGASAGFSSAVALPSHSTYQVGVFGNAYGGTSMTGKAVEAGLWLSPFNSTDEAVMRANQRQYWGF